MHEMSYVVRIVNQAIQTAEEKQACQVLSVSVVIGEMTGIEEDYLQRYYKTACQGTILENSLLRSRYIPVRAKCDDCGNSYHPDREHDYLCPVCRSARSHITEGRGVILQQVELETI